MTMKLQSVYPEVVRRFTRFKPQALSYAGQLRCFGNCKNFEVGLGWDLLHMTFSSEEVCSWYAKFGCNDANITTMLKKAVHAVMPEVFG